MNRGRARDVAGRRLSPALDVIHRKNPPRRATTLGVMCAMNPSSSSEKDKRAEKPTIVVPRDSDVDTAESSRREVTPSPDTINIRDEEYPSDDKPLAAESPEARTLHERRPRAPDQLEVGSAGDAARPTKTGIMKTTLPPRSDMK